MKKLYILLSALPLFMTSCFESSTNSDFKIFKDERYSFVTISESENSEKQVYYLTINVRNRTDDTITLNKTDFKLKFSEKSYDCLYFVDSYRSGSMSINGVVTSYNYIEKKSDTTDIKKQVENENGSTSMENIYIAFDSKPADSTNYEILYKDSALKTVLDK